MQVTFWGTRGSVPTPGPANARYGGNTSCVEVRTRSGPLLVIDGGTGLRDLGQRLLAREQAPVRGHLLISHTHWDHIQGIPFFAPLLVPGNEWDIYGPKGVLQGIREALSGQMQHTYFPVSLEQLGASIRCHDLLEGTFTIGGIAVTARYLNHPALTLGYRIEADGATLAYCCDHEPHAPGLVSGEGPLAGHDKRYAQFVAGADLVIHDAQYTAEDFPAKAGWGHSSVEYAIRVCEEAGVARIALTHHDPGRSDAQTDAIVAEARRKARERGSALEIAAAAEGETIELAGRSHAGRPAQPPQFPAQTAIDMAAASRPVLVCVNDSGMQALLSEAMAEERLSVERAENEAGLVRLVSELRPSLVLLEHAPGDLDAIHAVRAIRAEEGLEPVKVPIVVIAREPQAGVPESESATDWLVWPITPSYARAKIRAWVLRTASRHIRARLPAPGS